MTFNEFTEYMKENLDGYQGFYALALDYQNLKNSRRKEAKRWNEAKIDRAIEQMWKQSMQVLYDQIKSQVDRKAYDPRAAWIEYMEKQDIFGAVNEGLTEIEFE